MKWIVQLAVGWLWYDSVCGVDSGGVFTSMLYVCNGLSNVLCCFGE